MFSNLLLIGIIGGIGLAAVALGPFFSADIATAQTDATAASRRLVYTIPE